jgi:hypothetical protein
VDGLNYSRMKLFLLSMLWRMGVSNHHFFRGVALGGEERRLRRMLLSNEPGEADRHACQLRLIQFRGSLLANYQSEPWQFTFRGRRCCSFFSTGIRFDFMVSHHRAPRENAEHYVSPLPHYRIPVEPLGSHPVLVRELVALGVNKGWLSPERAHELSSEFTDVERIAGQERPTRL